MITTARYSKHLIKLTALESKSFKFNALIRGKTKSTKLEGGINDSLYNW